MFYIDRDYFSKRPDLKAFKAIQDKAIEEIQRFGDEEKNHWLKYYASNSDTPNLEPNGKWTSEPIPTALYNVFRGNCAFCGTQIMTKYFSIDNRCIAN
jgi:hypothetical protein